jgi:hypothetical protein
VGRSLPTNNLKADSHEFKHASISIIISDSCVPFAYRLDIGPGPDGIRALVWEYLDAPWFSGFRFVQPGQVLEALMVTFPRFLFIFLVFKQYRTRSKQRWMVAMGVLGALFPGVISLISIVGWVQGWTQPPPSLSDPFFPIYIPFPSILILATLLLKLIPVGDAGTPDADSA